MKPSMLAAATVPVVAATTVPSLSSDWITENPISFAQAAALDVPAAALGTGMRQGILAAFEEANRADGIHGRMLHFDSFDDGYEPDRPVARARGVIDRNRHLGLIGIVGTPTKKATQPVASSAR